MNKVFPVRIQEAEKEKQVRSSSRRRRAFTELEFSRYGMVVVKAAVRRLFPQVKQISPNALNSWLKDVQRIKPHLLDVRSVKEFEVSHIPGAIQVEPNARAEDLKHLRDSDAAIVVYCAGGYRSSRLARRLSQAGFGEVYNLDGAIFAWANAGLPLESKGRLVDTVCVSGKVAGLFLKAARRNPH